MRRLSKNGRVVGVAAVVVAVALLASIAVVPSKFDAAGFSKKVFAAIGAQAESSPSAGNGSVDEARLVRAMTIASAPVERSYVLSGEVRGRYESYLAFQTGGRIVKRNVQLGDEVQVGDVLMEIDPKDIRELVNMSDAQVRAAESQRRLAEANLKRFQRLYETGAIPRAQLDQLQAAFDAASAACEQASAQRVQASNQLGYSRLCADKPGVIAGVSAEVGQVVGPGLPVLTLVQDGEREVESSVPENRVDSLRKATSIKVTFWALPGVEVPGEIREVAPMADPILRTYKVRVRLLAQPPEMKLGMTSSVQVDGSDGIAQSRQIPLSAVYQVQNTPNVWVVKDDRLELRRVELDGYGEDSVRVLKGLEDGDVIVTAGVHKLMSGQKVRVMSGDAR